MILSGTDLILRPITEDDLTLINRWSNDQEVGMLLDEWHGPYSMDSTRHWYFNKVRGAHNEIRLIIDTAALGPIGSINLVNINPQEKSAFYGVMIGERTTFDRGYGTRAIKAIMIYAFDELKLQKLNSSIIEYNKRSLHVHCNKLGWKVEKIEKDWYWRHDRHWDRIIISAEATEFNREDT